MPAEGANEEEVVAAAQERVDDIEDEFGPDAPPRGATPPANPDAEEAPA
jgi:hypothetical protein